MNELKHMQLPSILWLLLKINNVTTKELSESTGLYLGWLDCLIDGIHNDNYHKTSLDTIAKIASYFDVSIDYLIYGKEKGINWQPIGELTKETVAINDALLLLDKRFPNMENPYFTAVCPMLGTDIKYKDFNTLIVNGFYYRLDDIKEQFTYFAELTPPNIC